MKQIKTLLAALFVAMAGTASAQTNYVHITLNDNSVVHYSQDDIKSMIIDTEEPEELKFVTFTDGTNTVKVAKMNLGATSVADGTSCYGDYYAWGATTTFATVNQSTGAVTPTKTGGYSQANAPYYENGAYTAYIGSGNGKAALTKLEAADDAVAANMPGWHMPTQAELQTLYAACGGTDTELLNPIAISSGSDYVKGMYWVEGATSAVTIGGDKYKANGLLFVQDATHHVFFPAAGSVGDTYLYSAGDDGNYWSSSLDESDTDRAYYLNFGSNGVFPGKDFYRYAGFPVRPFKDAE